MIKNVVGWQIQKELIQKIDEEVILFDKEALNKVKTLENPKDKVEDELLKFDKKKLQQTKRRSGTHLNGVKARAREFQLEFLHTLNPKIRKKKITIKGHC